MYIVMVVLACWQIMYVVVFVFVDQEVYIICLESCIKLWNLSIYHLWREGYCFYMLQLDDFTTGIELTKRHCQSYWYQTSLLGNLSLIAFMDRCFELGTLVWGGIFLIFVAWQTNNVESSQVPAPSFPFWWYSAIGVTSLEAVIDYASVSFLTVLVLVLNTSPFFLCGCLILEMERRKTRSTVKFWQAEINMCISKVYKPFGPLAYSQNSATQQREQTLGNTVLSIWINPPPSPSLFGMLQEELGLGGRLAVIHDWNPWTLNYWNFINNSFIDFKSFLEKNSNYKFENWKILFVNFANFLCCFLLAHLLIIWNKHLKSILYVLFIYLFILYIYTGVG